MNCGFIWVTGRYATCPPNPVPGLAAVHSPRPAALEACLPPAILGARRRHRSRVVIQAPAGRLLQVRRHSLLHIARSTVRRRWSLLGFERRSPDEVATPGDCARQ